MKFLLVVLLSVSGVHATPLNVFSSGEKIESQKINEIFDKIIENQDNNERLTKKKWFSNDVCEKCFASTGSPVPSGTVLGNIGTFSTIVDMSGSFRITTSNAYYGIPHSIGSNSYMVPIVNDGAAGNVSTASSGWEVDQVNICVYYTK